MKGEYKENYTEEYHKKTAKTKNKIKILRKKGKWGRHIIFWRATVRQIADLSIETIKSRRQRNDIFKVLKENERQSKMLTQKKIPSRINVKKKRINEIFKQTQTKGIHHQQSSSNETLKRVNQRQWNICHMEAKKCKN